MQGVLSFSTKENFIISLQHYSFTHLRNHFLYTSTNHQTHVIISFLFEKKRKRWGKWIFIFPNSENAYEVLFLLIVSHSSPSLFPSTRNTNAPLTCFNSSQTTKTSLLYYKTTFFHHIIVPSPQLQPPYTPCNYTIILKTLKPYHNTHTSKITILCFLFITVILPFEHPQASIVFVKSL